MSTADVFRKDILDVRRAKIVWFVGALFTLLVVLFFYQVQEFGGIEGTDDMLLALWNLVFVGAMFVPAVALVAAYLSIAGERESGSLKFLLSTPISRRDVVLGKFLSRTAVVAASLVFAFAVSVVLAAAWFGLSHLDAFLGIAALTLLYSLAYVAVAIAISASTASRSRAMGGALGFYFVTNVLVVFEGLSIRTLLDWLLNTVLGLGIAEDPLTFLMFIISPTQSFFTSTALAFPDQFLIEQGMDPGEASWYIQGEVGLAFLFVWLVVPLVLGLWRFEHVNID